MKFKIDEVIISSSKDIFIVKDYRPHTFDYILHEINSDVISYYTDFWVDKDCRLLTDLDKILYAK